MELSGVRLLADRLLNKHELFEKGWRFSFDRAKRRAGSCKFSKKEILFSIKKIFKEKLPINVKNLNKNLYTGKYQNPDILIRTGGQQRLSDFMLLQLAYTEFFFLKKLWPDFSTNDLDKIISKFILIKRNYGT